MGNGKRPSRTEAKLTSKHSTHRNRSSTTAGRNVAKDTTWIFNPRMGKAPKGAPKAKSRSMLPDYTTFIEVGKISPHAPGIWPSGD
jgi:hypothetical protein